MKIKIASIYLVAWITTASFPCSADTIYFKNGRSIEGVVKSESGDTIEIYVGFGSITCRKDQIKSIECSTEDERAELYKRWAAKREVLSKPAARPHKDYEEEAPQTPPSGKPSGIVEKRLTPSQAIIVEALLNDNVHAKLVLDTGASLVVLSKRIGEKLGIDLTNTKKNAMTLKLAGDKTISAKMIFLDSVKVQGKEVNKVMAAVLTEDFDNPDFNDGLLGMTFLSQFHFKIDPQNKTVKLEPIV